uniref:Uncharacterized protein n=1 Tax=Anopheles dirus TaxID=7168 RepID=A0A182NXI5_9DIPT
MDGLGRRVLHEKSHYGVSRRVLLTGGYCVEKKNLEVIASQCTELLSRLFSIVRQCLL